MSLDERAITFDCAGERLVGIVATTPGAGPRGVVVVVGGPQYRVGSHRQFVQLARALALAGFPTLRFDVRGMGDASGPPPRFDELDDDVDAAIGALQRACPQVREVVLWGLCDGASAIAIHAARRDPRVRGIVLANPWVRDDATYAGVQIRHYYAGRLRSRAFWRRLATGEVKLGDALRGAAGTLRKAMRRAPAAPVPRPPFQARMASGVERFDGALLLLLSGQDLTAREFETHAAAQPAWQRALARPQARRCDVAAADHTFSQEAWRNAAERATVEWLRAW